MCAINYIVLSLIYSKYVLRYLHNRCRREQKTPNFHKKWTHRDILIDNHRKELDEMSAEMSGAKSGSRAYLACYRKAVKVIEERLGEDTLVAYQAEAKEWTEKMPPPRMQHRYVYANYSLRYGK